MTGLIEGGNWNYMGGLVGSANGKLTIENCRVSTQISTTFDSNTLSANVGIGGFVGLLSSQYNQCHITGCVFDGLIYNPNYSGTTYGCGGFVGCFSQYDMPYWKTASSSKASTTTTAASTNCCGEMRTI